MPQLRQNVITGEWVVIAPERAKRPNDFIIVDTVKSPVGAHCPFEVGNKEYTERSLKNFETELIYVLPNKFPAFLEDPHALSTRSFKMEDDFYTAKPALGGNDVIVIKDHTRNLYTFTKEMWADLMQVTRRRYQYWRRDRKVEYTMAIYNEGTRSGASIIHPHAQIFAADIIPNQVHREIVGSQAYFENNGSCVFCDLIAHEKKQKVRIICEDQYHIAFTFYAARFPFEVWILPKKHVAHLEDESDKTMAAAGESLRLVFEKIGRILRNPPANYFIHDLPNNIIHSDFYHWHIEIAPRVATYGGYEMGSAVIIDVVAPEDAAKFLRGERLTPPQH